MVFHSDLHQFVTILRGRLGPQLANVPLIYHGAPELKDILALFHIQITHVSERLSSEELRVRFQSVVEGTFASLADVRLLALVCFPPFESIFISPSQFLDDLHFADEASVFFIVVCVAN